MLETSHVLYGATVLLFLLFLLCIYLVINNVRMRKKAKRKAEFLTTTRDTWVSAILDGEETDIRLANTEQSEWTTDIFLSYANNYDDPNIRSRVSQLSDDVLAPELSTKLNSRGVPIRQYALLVINQLEMTSLHSEVAALRPQTDLEAALTSLILEGETSLAPFNSAESMDPTDGSSQSDSMAELAELEPARESELEPWTREKPTRNVEEPSADSNVLNPRELGTGFTHRPVWRLSLIHI